MTRRRWIALGCLLILALVLELMVGFGRGARTRVKIINNGLTPIENLVVSYGGSRISLGNLRPGETGFAYLSATGKGTLDLAFTQKGNPMAGCQVAEYDPGAHYNDGLEQVLEIKANQVTKYLDDAPPATPFSRLLQWILNQISSELNMTRL